MGFPFLGTAIAAGSTLLGLPQLAELHDAMGLDWTGAKKRRAQAGAAGVEAELGDLLMDAMGSTRGEMETNTIEQLRSLGGNTRGISEHTEMKDQMAVQDLMATHAEHLNSRAHRTQPSLSEVAMRMGLSV
jgi:hypothetical protein